MAWITPKTWTTGEALTASDLNTQLRDNLNALKMPPTAAYSLHESANFSTTSTTFVSVDATALSLSITTTGGDVLIGFVGSVANVSNYIYWDVTLDGVRLGGDDGICLSYENFSTYLVSFVYLATGVSAGAHTFRLQWKVGSGTAVMLAGTGVAGADVHPQFWVREV